MIITFYVKKTNHTSLFIYLNKAELIILNLLMD